MTESLLELLSELEEFGQANVGAIAERSRRMLNITRDTGRFLSVLVRATNATRLLEIGTSNGYSTLWLADAVRATGGRVTTVELSEFKVGLATKNFARSGLSRWITLHHGDAGPILAAAPDESFDLVFLDAERREYPGWWPDLKRLLRGGGLLVVDNATSHASQLAPLVALVETDPGFATCVVPIGNGEYLAARSGGPGQFRKRDPSRSNSERSPST